MKLRISLCISAVFALMMISCSSYDEPIDVGRKQSNQTICEDGSITIDEAVRIADKFLRGSNPSRSASLSVSKVSAITESNELASKVSKIQNDTVAYIVNYTSDEGFVIVSSKRISNPILAYSDKGNFSMENESANECFVKKIGAYLAQSEILNSRSDEDFNGLIGCYMVTPLSDTNLSQVHPFNKYLVVGENEKCCIGCAPVAVANILLHGSNILKFQNRTFYMKGILHAYSPGYANGNWTPTPPGTVLPGILDGNYHPKYTYDQARDSIARLMTLLSYRLIDKRTSEGAYIYKKNSIRIWNFLDSMPQITLSSTFTDFDGEQAVDYLKNGNIIYTEGLDLFYENGEFGHAWIIDGCSYCVDDADYDQPPYKDYYMRCDWGWGGSCNGYFKGDIIEISEIKEENGASKRFLLTDFFAAKLNTVKYMINEQMRP